MNRKFSLLFALTLLLLISTNAFAQLKQHVRFLKGASSTTVNGTIHGYAYRDYIVSAREGQTLSVKGNSKKPSTFLTIFKPDGNNLDGATETNEFAGALPATGDYVIRVGMMRSEARRKNSVSNYSLKISI